VFIPFILLPLLLRGNRMNGMKGMGFRYGETAACPGTRARLQTQGSVFIRLIRFILSFLLLKKITG